MSLKAPQVSFLTPSFFYLPLSIPPLWWWDVTNTAFWGNWSSFLSAKKNKKKAHSTPLCNNKGMGLYWTVLEWIYFQWYQRKDKDSWSKSHCHRVLGTACKRTPQVLGAKFRQDEGAGEALSGHCMIRMMDVCIDHVGELILNPAEPRLVGSRRRSSISKQNLDAERSQNLVKSGFRWNNGRDRFPPFSFCFNVKKKEKKTSSINRSFFSSRKHI